jgi:hypothetical protein
MADPRIFISMGTPYAPKYADFRLTLERFIRDECKADPRILGVNEYPAGNPLSKIRDVMRTCDGVLIVAYERNFIGDGFEKRASSTPIALRERTYTTSWNHIESALAYSLDLPIYVICETGLTEDGLIETTVDWFVQRMELTQAGLHDAAVSQSIRTWIDERVRPRSAKPRALKAFEGTMKLSEMTPKEIWGAGALVVTIFVAGMGVGRWMPLLFG